MSLADTANNFLELITEMLLEASAGDIQDPQPHIFGPLDQKNMG
jgi:hypothetical protein